MIKNEKLGLRSRKIPFLSHKPFKKVEASPFNARSKEIEIFFQNIFYRAVTDSSASFWNFTYF